MTITSYEKHFQSVVKFQPQKFGLLLLNMKFSKKKICKTVPLINQTAIILILPTVRVELAFESSLVLIRTIAISFSCESEKTHHENMSVKCIPP